MKHLEGSHSALLDDLADILERHGEPQPESAAAAKARLNNLAKRNSMLEAALREERSITEKQKRNEAERNETHAAIAKIYLDAGLEEGDEQGLVSLLDRLPQYRKLLDTKQDLESKNSLDRTELGKAGEAELTEQDALSLEKLKGKLEAMLHLRKANCATKSPT